MRVRLKSPYGKLTIPMPREDWVIENGREGEIDDLTAGSIEVRFDGLGRPVNVPGHWLEIMHPAEIIDEHLKP